MNALVSFDLHLLWPHWLCIQSASVLPLFGYSSEYSTEPQCLSFWCHAIKVLVVNNCLKIDLCHCHVPACLHTVCLWCRSLCTSVIMSVHLGTVLVKGWLNWSGLDLYHFFQMNTRMKIQNWKIILDKSQILECICVSLEILRPPTEDICWEHLQQTMYKS